MEDSQTIVFGVPVPSDDPLFIAIVIIHILIGLICVISGLVAMLSNKRKGIHTIAGKIYFWSIPSMFVTITLLSVMRWPHNTHLLIVGITTFIFTYLGRKQAHNPKPGWARLHTICMGLSYILLLTGFYVDNGKNLPFWKQFSELFFWIFPSAVGIPLIIHTLFRHPLNRKK